MSIFDYATHFVTSLHPRINFPMWINYELFINEKIYNFIEHLTLNIIDGEYSIYEYSDTVIGYNGIAFIDASYEYKISQGIDALFRFDTSIHENGSVPKRIIDLIIVERVESLLEDLDI